MSRYANISFDGSVLSTPSPLLQTSWIAQQRSSWSNSQPSYSVRPVEGCTTPNIPFPTERDVLDSPPDHGRFNPLPLPSQHHRTRSVSPRGPPITTSLYATEAYRNVQFFGSVGAREQRLLRFSRVREHIQLLNLRDRIDIVKFNHVISKNQEHKETKSMILGRMRSHTTRRSALSSALLTNDHDPYVLAPKIVRMYRERLGNDGLVEGPPHTHDVCRRGGSGVTAMLVHS